MKFVTNCRFMALIIVIILSMFGHPIRAQKKPVAFWVINPTKEYRNDELIIINREFVRKLAGLKNPMQKFKLQLSDGTFIPVQFDDLDKNKEWDEAVFLLNLKPKEKVEIRVYKSSQIDSYVASRAHVRQRRKNNDDTFGPLLERDSIPAGQENTDFSKQKLPQILTEGPSWENDRVGFRIYMDVRNTKDIWGKTTPDMMMDTVGVDPNEFYHQRAPWGMDILAVGRSLGAGSLALKIKLSNGQDSLIRLGGMNMGRVTFERLVDGPLRAIFRMHYPEWRILPGLQPVSITEEISIWGGQYFYQSKVTIKGAPKSAMIVTGMVNLKSHQSVAISEGRTRAIYTFDAQSENNDHLGLAIAVARQEGISFSQTKKGSVPGIADTYTVGKTLNGSQPFSFRFYAAWEPSNRLFADEGKFKEWLKAQVKCYETPVEIMMYK